MNIWISSIVGIIVGWLLGFWGTLRVEQRKRKQLEKDFKESLFAELKEVLPILVCNYYLLNRDMGNINRDILNWVYSMRTEVEEKLAKPIKQIENLLKLSDIELVTRFPSTGNFKNSPTSLNKLNLSFLKENISSFSLLYSPLRGSILAVRTKIGFLNEIITQRNFYFEKTFETGLTAENSSILDENIKRSSKALAQQCRRTAEMIRDLILREYPGNKTMLQDKNSLSDKESSAEVYPWQ